VSGGFADYYGQTNLHAFALSFAILLGVVALFCSRRHAILPLLIAATTVPMAQRIVLAGADFTLLRILLLIYLVRVIVRGEARGYAWNRLDGWVLLWAGCGVIVMTLHHGTATAFLNRLGWAYDILLTYFVVRCLVRDWYDFLTLARGAALISLPIAAIFLLEWKTGYNAFAVFGGVPFETWIREGRLRCQGPFPHPIIAGAFWAAMLPIISSLFFSSAGDFRRGVAAAVAVLLIVLTTSSSTPILSLGAAGVGIAFFALCRYRRFIWVSVVVVLALLHFVVMKAPVWHLMARVDVFGGSTGWHRFVIFDAFIANFAKWYLMGEVDPESWGIWEMRDVTNHYVVEGLNGGLWTLLALIGVLVVGFANVGRVLRLNPPTPTAWYAWMVGVALFVHVVTFFGIAYFGQMIVLLYLHLGLAGSLSGSFPVHSSDAGQDVHERKSIAAPSSIGTLAKGRPTFHGLNPIRAR
jgi:hypothetical protein